jgi:hypothetical protein
MFNCNHFIVSQTNPHIAPLLNLKKTLSRRWANLLELELRHRCAQLQWVLPDWAPSKWLNLFTQPWEGDVTLVLPSHLWNLGKTMVNPTTHDIIAATKQGELATWEKLSAVEANCAIEATLDACLARLTNKARERPLNGLSSRIPSWLSMPAIGQQAVASWGNPLDAGASPGGRLWAHHRGGGGSGSCGGGGLGSRHGSLGHLGGSGSGAAGAAALLAAAKDGASAEMAIAAAAHASAAAVAMDATPGTAAHAAAAMGPGGAGFGGLHSGFTYGIVSPPPPPTMTTAAHGQCAPLAPTSPRLLLRRPPGALAAQFAAAATATTDSSGAADLIHEGMPDVRPPRMASWGSSAVADSVSDFPASYSAQPMQPSSRHNVMSSCQQQHHRQQQRGGLLVSIDSRACLVDEEGLPPTPGSAASSAGSKNGSSSSSSRTSSSSSSGARVPAAVVGQLDCCDASAITDIWGSLLPLARSALALEAVAASSALDYIAP